MNCARRRLPADRMGLLRMTGTLRPRPRSKSGLAAVVTAREGESLPSGRKRGSGAESIRVVGENAIDTHLLKAGKITGSIHGINEDLLPVGMDAFHHPAGGMAQGDVNGPGMEGLGELAEARG